MHRIFIKSFGSIQTLRMCWSTFQVTPLRPRLLNPTRIVSNRMIDSQADQFLGLCQLSNIFSSARHCNNLRLLRAVRVTSADATCSSCIHRPVTGV